MEHFGKYQLIRKLATGGMAEVFLAKSAGPMGFEKILVVKRILPHLAEDPAFVQKFLAEAKLAARLDHPNVVTIFDLGEENGEYYIAMEYIDGPSLRSVCRRLERTNTLLPPAFCAKIISMACEGLAYAHDSRDPETGKWLGIIHRDVSPENILLSRTGTVKVVDFGLAKASEVSETRSKILFGKYFYMAPEQLRRRDKLDRRVDVYALGVVLYELLTSGKKPYEASGEVEMMRAILAEQTVPISKRRRDVPPALERVLEKAMASREQRYADCMQFQMDLEAFILQTGSSMGTQQISRIMAEMGLLSQGATGNQLSPPPVTKEPPPEATRATPSIAAFERENIQYTRATPSTEASEYGNGGGNLTRATPSTEAGETSEPLYTRATPSTEAAERASVPMGNETRMLDVGRDREDEDPPDQPTQLDLSRNGLETSGSYKTGLAMETSGSYDTVNPPQEATRLMAPGERALPRSVEPGADGIDQRTSGSSLPTVMMQSGVPLREPPTTTTSTGGSARLRSPWPWITLAAGALLLVVGIALVVLRMEPEPLPAPVNAHEKPEPRAPDNPVPTAWSTMQRGRIRIVCEPPADVRVNGDLVGRSPVDVVDHEIGELSIEVSDKTLGFRKDARVDLTSGDNGTKTITVERLEVQIHVRPKSQISVDGRPVGEMSNARVPLFEGWHKVHLVNRELNKDLVKDFIVLPGQANIFNYDLRH